MDEMNQRRFPTSSIAIIRLLEAIEVGSIALTMVKIIIVEMNAPTTVVPRTNRLVCPVVATKVTRMVERIRYRNRLGARGRTNRCRYLRASVSAA